MVNCARTASATSFQAFRQYTRYSQQVLVKYLLALYFAALPASVFAQTWTGAGADDFWFNTLNWSPGTVPNSSTANASIGAPSPTIVNGNVNLNTLTVDANGQVTLNAGLSLGFTGAATTTLSNSGTMSLLNGSFLELQFGIVNSGLIDVQAGASATTLGIPDGIVASLSGGGTINLSGANATIVRTGFGTAFLSLVDQTIQGQGQISGFINIDNQANGLIHANSAGNTFAITIASGTSVTNQGILRASNGGILALASNVTNTGGLIEALDGSEVQLSNDMTVTGGTLSSTASGLIRVMNSANFSNLTLHGNLELNNGATTELRGAINNTGNILVNAGANVTALAIDAPTGTTLSGGGTITLSGANARITRTDNFTASLTITDQTIQGQGSIGGGSFVNIVNQSNGLIHANSAGNTLAVDLASSSAFSNVGTLRASNGGTLHIDRNFVSSGTMDVGTGSMIVVEGSVESTSSGLITGSGLVGVNSQLSSSGTIAPGNSAGTLVIDVNGGFESFSMGPTSIFAVELASSSSYDVLDLNAIASLNGQLTVDLVGGYLPAPSDVFTILTADNVNPLSQPLGAFNSNAPTVTTLGGEGTFTINYVGNKTVVLSNFTVPEPGSACVCLIVGAVAVGRRKRERFCSQN